MDWGEPSRRCWVQKYWKGWGGSLSRSCWPSTVISSAWTTTYQRRRPSSLRAWSPMIPQLHSIDNLEEHFLSTYLYVFTGLGKLKGVRQRSTLHPLCCTRERHMSPAADETMAKLEAAESLMRPGFWQVPVHKESSQGNHRISRCLFIWSRRCLDTKTARR